MGIGWLIGLASSSILFFFAYFFFSSNNYKRRFKDKYDLRNHFPYEFNYESKFFDNPLGNVSLIMSMLFSIAFYSLTAVYNNKNGLVLFVLISGIIYSILIIVLNFVPIKYLKTFLIISIFLFAASFICPASIALASWDHYRESKNVIALVLLIVAAIVALFNFVLTMNPKLSLNIKMNVATDEKGNEYYVRPKYIMMAFSEWIMFFSLLIDDVLLVVFLTII